MTLHDIGREQEGAMPAPGFLAIWSEIAPEHETDYLHWLTREHTAERVGIPGFRGVRVFRAIAERPCRYFILYALDSAAVVDAPDYLARLNAPSDWSTRIMPRLGGFRRGGGSLGRRCGMGNGGVIAVAAVDGAPKLAVATDGLPALAAMDRICAASTLLVDAGRTGIATREKGLRVGDDAFAGLLLIEGLDHAAVTDCLAASGLVGEAHAQIFSLGRDEITGERDQS